MSYTIENVLKEIKKYSLKNKNNFDKNEDITINHTNKKFTYWTKNGKFETENWDSILFEELHSPNNDTPALIDQFGNKFYCCNGVYHREKDLPALEYENGKKEWYYNGNQHRLSGPWLDNEEDTIYCLYGKSYYNINSWLKNHPDPDIYFDAIGMNETERVLWYLKN